MAASNPDERTERVTGIVKLLDVGVFLVFAVFALWWAQWTLRSYVGLAIAIAGFLLWMTARKQLGASFSLGAEARGLVTTGVYSKFRHPIYLFAFVAYTGLFLIWGRWFPFLVFGLFNTVQLYRIRKEEAVLEQTFGEAYLRYRASTWI